MTTAPATPPERPARRSAARRAAAVAVLIALAALWVLAARALSHSVVPASLHLSHLDPHRFFTRHELARSRSYGRFLSIDRLLADLALIATLAVYARHGARYMRESAAGPIGTGMLLGMLGLAFVWLAQLPFGVAELWWQRRHHVAHIGYVSWIVDDFLGLAGPFLFICAALLVVMGLARLLRGAWWVPGALVFVALALLLAWVTPFLTPELHPLREPAIAADAHRLAAAEGVPGTRFEVQRVRRFTSAPNAEAVGFGATRRVILWDTLLGGRFSRRQIAVVSAHELGHVAHDDILRGVGWFGLFAVPAAFLIALLTRRRGGMATPEAVPLALLVFFLLHLLAGPLENIHSRRVEVAADWAALQTTRDPAAAIGLFRRLSTTSHDDPDPPAWDYVLSANHPTVMQRIAMVVAWKRSHRRAR